MKKTCKKLLAYVLAVMMLLSCVPFCGAFAAEIVDSGTCGAQGDNVTWTLDSEGTLTVSGEGDMANYTVSPFATEDEDGDPYGNESIKRVIINDGVTSIGNSFLRDCYNVTSVEIPESVKTIGNSSFDGCESLESIIIPDSVTSIGNNAFGDCYSLEKATLSNRITEVEGSTFSSCESLTDIVIP
ncbi:MAG: leucine-rich repeat domain-containing protein, partial [Ruminococcus sp.]|nr:leucine-rich repeat domain-containing protein [Ruminococcus sp.]